MTFKKLGESINFRDAIIANGTFELFRNGTLPVPQDIEVLWNVNIIKKATFTYIKINIIILRVVQL